MVSRLKDGVLRLEAALERLDRALAARASADDGERAALRAELDAALRRNEEMGTLTDRVADRLDRAAGRAASLLES